MLEEYKTVYEGGMGEIIEKKSRFIATVRPVQTEEEALGFIEEMRKKYWDATHNCFAYVIGERREIMRCSDDGEPGGTAGKPMLDVLLGEELYNTAVVVTRYFGGTLLGTGGLVRAYSKAVQEGLSCSRVICKHHGALLEVGTDYNGVGKLQYLFAQKNVPILDSEYTETVKMQILVPAKELERIKKDVTEATSGRASVTELKELYYAVSQGEQLLFEN
ncbi:MAG TPA: YigZ family protein [Candidatus Blautia merdigallinarum]|uniref:YigZ family protein n=1 Tax=Candidatus Blautia merdigallinarum TaxID=2838495 RepID=A0A9D2N8T1_9FIRM|nr:YigZ family protein [Candidatus Blautia merdigallinarum]